jgi:hypothetical protein
MKRWPGIGIAVLVLVVALGAGHVALAAQQAARPPADSYEATLRQIAQAIEGLKAQYPQLAEFKAATHYRGDHLTISYGYRTEAPARTGGWTSGVPHPAADGVWFLIDVHDPDSMAELHRQPVVPGYQLRDKRVMFLLLEGAGTRSLHAKLHKILLDHGVKPLEGL